MLSLMRSARGQYGLPSARRRLFTRWLTMTVASQDIAQACEPARARHHAVELVAMQHQQPLTARGAMHPLAVYFELALEHLRQHSQTRVVVARDIDESRAAALPRQQR